MVKFLVIRFSSIGDIVLTTPVIRCLHDQVEDAEIHFLTKKQFEPVLKANPYIHKLWLLEDNLSTLLDEIEESQPDYIIDLHNNLRTGILKKRLKLASFSFNKINLRKWLLVNFKINKLPQKHIVDRYLETTRIFDIINDGRGLDYYISKEDAKLPPEIEKGIPDDFISLVIGAQHSTKKMPPELLAELCDLIEVPVVILGGPGDTVESGKILQLSNHKRLIDTCGKLSLNQSAELIKRSHAAISHDTGLMHIAASLDRPLVVPCVVPAGRPARLGRQSGRLPHPRRPRALQRMPRVRGRLPGGRRALRPASRLRVSRLPQLRRHLPRAGDRRLGAA